QAWRPASGGRRSATASSSTTTKTPRTARWPAPTRCAPGPTHGSRRHSHGRSWTNAGRRTSPCGPCRVVSPPSGTATRRSTSIRARWSLSIPTPRPPSRVAGKATSLRLLPEDLGELGGRSDLELIVAALRRPFVGTPAHEGGRMPEAGALQVVVLHLADALDPERLPGEVLALAPAAGRARHPSPSLQGAGPLPPRVRPEGVLAQRSECGRARRSASPSARRSKATKEAGVSAASFATREAAGCRRICSASKSSPRSPAITISPSTTQRAGRLARKAGWSSGK